MMRRTLIALSLALGVILTALTPAHAQTQREGVECVQAAVNGIGVAFNEPALNAGTPDGQIGPTTLRGINALREAYPTLAPEGAEELPFPEFTAEWGLYWCGILGRTFPEIAGQYVPEFTVGPDGVMMQPTANQVLLRMAGNVADLENLNINTENLNIFFRVMPPVNPAAGPPQPIATYELDGTNRVVDGDRWYYQVTAPAADVVGGRQLCAIILPQQETLGPDENLEFVMPDGVRAPIACSTTNEGYNPLGIGQIVDEGGALHDVYTVDVVIVEREG